MLLHMAVSDGFWRALHKASSTRAAGDAATVVLTHNAVRVRVPPLQPLEHGDQSLTVHTYGSVALLFALQSGGAKPGWQMHLVPALLLSTVSSVPSIVRCPAV